MLLCTCREEHELGRRYRRWTREGEHLPSFPWHWTAPLFWNEFSDKPLEDYVGMITFDRPVDPAESFICCILESGCGQWLAVPKSSAQAKQKSSSRFSSYLGNWQECAISAFPCLQNRVKTSAADPLQPKSQRRNWQFRFSQQASGQQHGKGAQVRRTATTRRAHCFWIPKIRVGEANFE